MSDKSGAIVDCRAILDELYNTSEIDLKILKLSDEKDRIEKSAKDLVTKNAQTPLDQNVYNDEYNKFSANFEKVKQKISCLENQKATQIEKQCQVETFLKNISKIDNFLDEFDEELWFSFVKNIVVNADGAAIVAFKNESNVKVSF